MEKVNVSYMDNNYPLYILPQDGRRSLILRDKGTQKGKVATWYQIVQKLNVDTVYDIGANYGEFLLPVLQRNVKTVVYEPNAKVFECLSRSVNESISDPSYITLVNAAVGDSNYTTTLYIPDSSGNASLEKSCVVHPEQIKPQEVEVHDIVRILEGSKDFAMKLDIEGTEYKVLDRIRQNDDSYNSYCIMFEFNKLSRRQTEIIEEFLDGKQVAGISRNEVELTNDSFFTYTKAASLAKLQGAHDVIVCKNVNWG